MAYRLDGFIMGGFETISEKETRKEILFALREDLCHLLVEESPNGIFILCGDSFEYFNRSFVKMIGLRPDELIEKSGEYILGLVHPEDKKRMMEWWEKSDNVNAEALIKNVRLLTERRKVVEADFSRVKSQPPRLIGNLRDVTELLEYRHQLQNQRNIFAMLLEEVGTPIFIIQNGHIKYANRAVYEALGYEPDEVIGTHFMDYIEEQNRLRIMQHYEERESWSQARSRFEFNIYNKQKQLVEVEMLMEKFEYDGTTAEVAILVDISERKKKEFRLKETLTAIRQAFGAIIKVLNKLVELKDPYTCGHQKRVAWIARLIAQEMKLSGDRIDALRLAAELHDVGKILVPAEILNKGGNLSETECAIIRSHSELGFELLKDIDFPWPVAEIVHQHHERLDGSGYPRGLKGEEIINEARILAVADVFEAMTSFRPYRPANSEEKAMAELEKQNLYDQEVVQVLKKLIRENRLKNLQEQVFRRNDS